MDDGSGRGTPLPSPHPPLPLQDGTIGYEIKLTGELSTNLVSPGQCRLVNRSRGAEAGRQAARQAGWLTIKQAGRWTDR